jgi:transposase, IS30 family
MKYNQLTAADRGAIQVLLHKNYTLTQIAREIGFHKSTVSREIKQRSTPRGYVAWSAQLNYEAKRKRCKQKKKLNQPKTQKYVVSKLQLGWSPEQIAGRMKLEGRKDRVCHETIYAWLYKDEWAHDEEKLYQYLRYGQKKRKKQNGRSVHRSKIPNRVSIHERPEVVNDRTEYGHWEGDSVIYPYKMAINTINELMTGKVKFTKLKRKTAKLTAQAMSNQLKDEIALTITLDNGTEFTKHETVSQNTGAQTYFCDPYSSWQRGANENANMLLRGYLPKRKNITDLTQDELEDIASELNNRPRKRLGYKTPNEVYNELLVNKKGSNQPSVALGSRM